MKREAKIRPKGDGKGKLKPRKLKGILCGKPHTFTIQPEARRIDPAKWELPEPPEKKMPRRKKQGVK